ILDERKMKLDVAAGRRGEVPSALHLERRLLDLLVEAEIPQKIIHAGNEGLSHMEPREASALVHDHSVAEPRELHRHGRSPWPSPDHDRVWFPHPPSPRFRATKAAKRAIVSKFSGMSSSSPMASR